MMDDLDLDRRVASARTELEGRVDRAAPDLRSMVRRSRRRRRSWGTALVVLAALVVAVPLVRDDGSSTVRTGPADVAPTPGGSTSLPTPRAGIAELLEPGGSRPLAPSPLAGRSTMAAVWTGDAMILWGGDSDRGPFDDGAAYDPRTGTWKRLPDGPLSARNAPAAVWTGDEVLLWGGHASEEGYRDGAAYDPATRRWRSIAEAPFASAGRPVGVWTGTEMVVLAGFNSTDAAAYDPATDRWRPLPDLPANLQPPVTAGVWTGSQVVALVQPTAGAVTGGAGLVALDPEAGGWTDLGQQPEAWNALAWTGDELLVASPAGAHLVGAGTRTRVASAPDRAELGESVAVWTGTELIVWNGAVASAVDPAAGTWDRIPAGASNRRTQPAAVWADGVLLVWGGFPEVATGIVLRPPA